MKYDWLDGYLRSMPGAEHDYKLEWQWDRYMVRGKLFAAICTPGPEYKPPYSGRTLINLKCDPRLSAGFRESYPEILPGFYMDKRTWIAVPLDGGIPEAVLRELCDLSYKLVVEKLPKYVQKQLEEERL
ncbi:MAG: MmcQ/YjbR family DNA-binding protein [Clostridiales bacterium]|nr:MmcQ/YjbR family DNA-binding protein [Clostridiales bacterium]MDY4181717.1 MmcQ/YjbR family DNA-binding protein [Pseudoflavonifractor sp.]